jgi:hypothetical protein
MTATTRTCGWCKTPTDSAVEVGLIERNSLPVNGHQDAQVGGRGFSRLVATRIPG